MTEAFAGKRVIVTGAGKGIGRATAVMLAGRGGEVVALSRSAADLEALEAEIGCIPCVVDLSDATATRAAVLAALPADLLVNCAAGANWSWIACVESDSPVPLSLSTQTNTPGSVSACALAITFGASAP